MESFHTLGKKNTIQLYLLKWKAVEMGTFCFLHLNLSRFTELLWTFLLNFLLYTNSFHVILHYKYYSVFCVINILFCELSIFCLIGRPTLYLIITQNIDNSENWLIGFYFQFFFQCSPVNWIISRIYFKARKCSYSLYFP